MNQGQGYVNQPTGCQTRTYVNPKDDEWETDLEVVTSCGRFNEEENGKVTVWVEPLAKVKIDALMKEYKSKEWLGYLLGDKESLTVKDVYIPDQNATSVRVDNIECEEFNDLPIIGVIHSHHNMGTNFSGTDHAYINQNHDISLLVAHSGLGGQVRTKLPCDAYMVSKVKVRVALTVDWDKDDWMKDAKKKIKSPIYTPPYANQPGRGVQQNGKSQFDGTGYWFNGEWHSSYPEKSVKTTQNIVRSWLCTSCDVKNYHMAATSCAHCFQPRFASKAEENQFKLEKEWQDWEKKDNKKVESTKDEWSSGIPKKNLGTYICGRCNTNWGNVDLKKFTNCPKCDRFSGVAKIDKERHQCPECQTVWTYDIGEKIRCIDCDEKKEKTEVETEVETHIQTESFRCKGCNVTWEIPVGDQLECPRCDADVDNLVEELKKDLEQAETEGVVKSTENYNCKACNQTYWTIEDARRCCTDKENEWTHPDYKCDICGKVTQFPNTTHAKCLQEQASTTPII